MGRRRGPPPKQLIRMFWRLRENPHLTDLELSNCLNIAPETISLYKWRLRNLKYDISSFCPNCFEKSTWQDRENGERVCKSCGLVVETCPSTVHTLPFDLTFQPSNNLAFGRGVGSQLSYGSTYRVLAKTRKGEEKKNVPIRQILAVVEQVDPPMVRSMLNYASRVLKGLGLDRDTDECHLLADYVGGMVRQAASVLSLGRWKVKPYLLVRAIVYYCLTKHKPSKTGEFLEKYKPSYKEAVFLQRVLALKKAAETELDNCG